MFFQGRDSPSPGDTPYLCRQRNSFGNFSSRLQELNEMEQGALLSKKMNGIKCDCPETNECSCPSNSAGTILVAKSVSKESCV